MMCFILFMLCLLPGEEEALERIKALHAQLELAPRDSYLNYAIATLARREGIDLKRKGIPFPLVPIVTDDPARRVDLFRLTTGALALHESLQLTELISERRFDIGDPVPLENLGAPDLPSLDFSERLVKERGEGYEPAIDDEARFIPHDWAYLRFRSGKDLLEFLDNAEAWSTHFLNFYGRGASDGDMLYTPFKRLKLPDPRVAGPLYRLLPGPIVICMSDLFFREGNDVTVVLPEGIPAELVPLEVRTDIDGRVVVSTSKKALDRILSLKIEDSLAQSADFKYMRSVLPEDTDEALYAYLSEAFLRRLVGPRLRVLESRRVRCASKLRTLTNACLLFHEEKGRSPSSLKELIEGKYIVEDKLRCPHGGTYSIVNGIAGECTAHGRLGHLTPQIELELTEVSEGEAAAYRRFARAYGNFWRRFFDPVGISAHRKGPSWDIDVVALPLAENSLYQNLASFAGGPPMKERSGLILPSTVVHITSKVDRSFLKDIDAWIEKRNLIRDEKKRKALHQAFGDHASLGLLDNAMLFTFDITAFLGQAVRWNLSDDVLIAPLIAGANLPVYVTVPVIDRARAEAFLTALEEGFVIRGRRPEGGSFSLKLDSYLLENNVHAVTVELFSFKFRFFYTLTDDLLVVAMRPDVLETVLSRGKPETGGPVNLALTLFPADWGAIRPDILLAYEEAARRQCHGFLTALRPFAALGLDGSAMLGRMECPDGGRYALDGDGVLACSLHGTPLAPRQGKAPNDENAVQGLLKKLERVSFSLTFIEDGLRCSIGIHCRE
jgi:hypothetical protein